jgi:hypothetical protein
MSFHVSDTGAVRAVHVTPSSEVMILSVPDVAAAAINTPFTKSTVLHDLLERGPTCAVHVTPSGDVAIHVVLAALDSATYVPFP